MSGEDTAVVFAERIESLLRGVLGQPDGQGSYVQLYETEGVRKTVISHVGSGITLRGEGKGVLRLQFSYECEMNVYGYLTIEKSSIRILPQNEGYLGAPFFHYDYLRDHHGDVPAAHINIHASNDEITKTMLQCGLKKRGRRRREKFVKNGVFPTVSNLHFPLGGNLFRPSLEDILEMVVYEFGIDTVDGWHDVLEASRVEYRTIQYKALVREHPHIALEALREAGLIYEEDSVPLPIRGTVDRLTAY